MGDERTNEEAESPVGDMTEQGQTDLGPIPELGNIANLEQAHLDELGKPDSKKS